MKLYKILENLLTTIEVTLHENPTAEDLAASLYISTVHLRRLFKASFGLTLASYIRSRRLALSLEELSRTDTSVIDIAVNHGFNHAQSYTRAFINEFGLTPGEFRKSGKDVTVKAPLQLLPSNEMENGALFGPEIVYLGKKIYCVGKHYTIYRSDGAEPPAKAARNFWLEERNKIPNRKDLNTFIGLTKIPADFHGYTHYYPSVRVKDLSKIPAGYEQNTIKAGLYVRFHYVGEHHYLDINKDIANSMYDAIKAFEASDTKYALFQDGIYFERISTADYDGKYCKMEWFSPIFEKDDKKSST
ncbi:MAG: helix-turn-helix domain-containing protein [Lachnospiraceae bacterium]|nr:helix-turn-helix domain-containing protein [Lachnospiraceae bacterium]